MNCRIQVLFEMAATAAHPSIMKSIISYMDRNMVPLCYKKPELLAQEINGVLNNMTNGYHIINSVPENLEEQQLYIDLQMEKSDEMGVVYLQGRFRVFVIQTEEPVIEDVFNIIASPGPQLEALNRQLYLYGETLDRKLFPGSKKTRLASSHPILPQASMVNL
ncbi:hypothetical protein [Syntrophomonas curvata]